MGARGRFLALLPTGARTGEEGKRGSSLRWQRWFGLLRRQRGDPVALHLSVIRQTGPECASQANPGANLVGWHNLPQEVDVGTTTHAEASFVVLRCVKSRVCARGTPESCSSEACPGRSRSGSLPFSPSRPSAWIRSNTVRSIGFPTDPFAGSIYQVKKSAGKPTGKPAT